MIDAATFAAWVQRFEGRVAHLYLDTRGLVTVGVGDLVDPLGRALLLPFAHPDGALASEEEIAADWWRVKGMRPGLLASRYASPDALRLDDEAIDALVERQLILNAGQLRRAFPELDDFPAPAQLAIHGMAWAMGSSFPATWPRFSAAARARKWLLAADESRIRNANADRNEGHYLLLLAAAREAGQVR